MEIVVLAQSEQHAILRCLKRDQRETETELRVESCNIWLINNNSWCKRADPYVEYTVERNDVTLRHLKAGSFYCVEISCVAVRYECVTSSTPTMTAEVKFTAGIT